MGGKGLLRFVEHTVDKAAKGAYKAAWKTEHFLLHDENRSGEQDAMKEVSGTGKGLLRTWALSGVHRAQSSKPASGYPKEAMSQLISDWAMAMIVCVLIAAGIGLVKAVIESFFACKAERGNAKESAPPSTMHYTDEINE